MDANRPELYIQELDDEANEESDELDSAFPNLLRGNGVDGYRVGVRLNGEYVRERVEEPEDAEEFIYDTIDEYSLDYEVPEQIDDLIIEERTWI